MKDRVKHCNHEHSPTSTEETGCPWWINSPKHNNCLWSYIEENSGPDGSMPELVQSQIANLLGWSNTKTHFMLKQAMGELVQALQTHHAKQLLNNESDDHFELSTYDMEPISNYTSDDDEK